MLKFLQRFSAKKISFNATAPNDDVLAIEIINDKIFIAQLKGTSGNWRLHKFDYTILDLPPDLNDESQRKNISRSIEHLVAKNQITTKNAAISIPTKNTIIRTVKAPLMNDIELEEAIKTNSLWENILNMGSINFDEYVIYHQVVRKLTDQNLMEVLFVGSQQAEIDKYIDIIEKASLLPVVVDVRCFALKSAIDINKPIKNEGKVDAILNISSDENYLMILRDNNQFITEIFTNTKDLNELKSNENKQNVVFGFLERYFLQVQEAVVEFNKLSKKEGKSLIDKIEISSPLYGISGVISQATKLLPSVEIKVLTALNKVVIPEQHKEKLKSLNNTSLSSGVLGLATRKLDVFGYYKFVAAVKNVNLLPNREKLINKKKIQIKNKRLVYLNSIFFLLFAAFFINNGLQVNKDFNKVNSIFIEVDKTNELVLAKLKALIIEKRKLETTAKKIKATDSNQKTTLSILKSITYSINNKISIRELDIKNTGDVEVIGLAVSDNEIVAFMEKLKGYELIKNIKLEYVKENSQGIKDYCVKFKMKEDIINAK